MDVLGIIMDDSGFAMDVLGFITNDLGDVVDIPCPIIHSLLQRNLTGCSLNVAIGRGARTW